MTPDGYEFSCPAVNGCAVHVVCFDVGVVEGVACGGHGSDFEVVYRREMVPIVALGIALTGDREAGVELAQEAMLRAFRDWSTVGQMERPGAWIRRVAINLARDARRRRVREQRALQRLATAKVAVPAPSDEEFWSAVLKLPERQRAVTALRYVEDLPVAAIASVMEISEGTVKTLLFRARRTLGRTLGVEEVIDAVDR